MKCTDQRTTASHSQEKRHERYHTLRFCIKLISPDISFSSPRLTLFYVSMHSFADCKIVCSDGERFTIPCHKILLSRSQRFSSSTYIPDEITAPSGVRRDAVFVIIKALYSDEPPELSGRNLTKIEQLYVEEMIGVELAPVLEHIAKFALSPVYSDASVRLECGSTVPVHKLVVCSRCFFRASLSSDWGMKESWHGEMDLSSMPDVDLVGSVSILACSCKYCSCALVLVCSCAFANIVNITCVLL